MSGCFSDRTRLALYPSRAQETLGNKGTFAGFFSNFYDFLGRLSGRRRVKYEVGPLSGTLDTRTHNCGDDGFWGAAMTKYFYVLSFGVLGVCSRFFLNELALRFLDRPFPTVTFGINILGSFLIGLVYTLGIERTMLSPEIRLGLMTGLIGGFTTFSAFSLEVFQLIEEARYLHAALYFGLSPVLGVAACIAGIYSTRLFLAGVS